MAKIFVEVFRENVPIAVRLEDITEHVKRAREMNCDEMRIIVSYDPANPGIELIFGRLRILTHRLDAHLESLKAHIDAISFGPKPMSEYAIDEIKQVDFESLKKRDISFFKKHIKGAGWPNGGFVPDFDDFSRNDKVIRKTILGMPALPYMSFHEFINIVSQSFKHLNLRDKDLLGGLDPQYYEKFIDEISKGPSVSLVAVCRKFGLKWKN